MRSFDGVMGVIVSVHCKGCKDTKKFVADALHRSFITRICKQLESEPAKSLAPIAKY